MKNKNRIYLCLAKMSDSGAEQHYIDEAFRTNWVAPLGPNVDGFEKDLEAFVNEIAGQARNDASLNKRVAALSSCTAAIHLALLQLGVGPGDEVLCQTFSFCASSNPVIYCGAKPVFVDSEETTWNMSPELLEQAIKDRMVKTGRKPKAIIIVDLYGMPADWDALEAIGEQYDIPIIEDAANALGSFYKGKPCGAFGALATFSFNGNKMITTSGGGALVCPDETSKQRAIYFATQARERCLYYQHEAIGYNYRMSNVCAGIGRGQMTVLEKHIAHHKHVCALYAALLNGVEKVTVHEQPDERCTAGDGREVPVFDSNYWLTTVTLGKGTDVMSVCEALGAAGIEARPLWKPMHLQPVFKDAPAYLNGVSESLFGSGLCLPSGPWVTDEDVRYIVDTLIKSI